MSLHYVALGDSTTVGVGDPMNGSSTTDLSGAGARPGEGWRGWASLLADSLGSSHRVTFSNFATSGATSDLVATQQLPEIGSGPIDLASLIVGINDTLRSTFDPGRVRDHLHVCAEELTARGALLLTVRFHDHAKIFGLPKWMGRPLWQRIEQVNLAYDDLHSRYGGIRLDMADYPEVYRRDFWSIDRMHPGERGHRKLARMFADELTRRGVRIDVPPNLDCAYKPPTKWADTVWMVKEGVPWLGRRAGDLLPFAARMALSQRRPASGALTNAEVQRLEA
ncbi:SGNH/GDSL hydrolase family protein [Kribbella albertanoniae]|uniref:SGNH/GDSL hydrolase family protein n=1 Tax=Kribbella albertanoniae TaxID=1266829 RepID=A0A4R4Q7S0_9ACTN|nr:SGNH/GDSL hydrolase family protein [Kribbella albertanoniae]TDC31247.1 SGNH/GDSL hydrolase family protein [Kribbella albertanoniae]